MRVTCIAKTAALGVDHRSFDTLSKIFLTAQRHSDTTLTFNMERAAHGNGSMTAVLAAVSHKIRVRNNKLDVGPRRYGYNKVRIEDDLFGTRCCTYDFNRFAFWSDATAPKAFLFDDQVAFNEHLLSGIIRQDWKKHIPIHYQQKAKHFLRGLFNNVVLYAGCDSRLFVSSSFSQGVLTFTLADSGNGVHNSISRYRDDILTHSDSIKAIFYQRYKPKELRSTLFRLGTYCRGNGGCLHIVSGNACGEFLGREKLMMTKLSSLYTGTIVSFSIKIYKPKLDP